MWKLEFHTGIFPSLVSPPYLKYDSLTSSYLGDGFPSSIQDVPIGVLLEHVWSGHMASKVMSLPCCV